MMLLAAPNVTKWYQDAFNIGGKISSPSLLAASITERMSGVILLTISDGNYLYLR